MDGELVLDLGGIHSAVPGSVNFRTGEVNENGTIMTLRQVFERNYRARNTGASDADVAAYLAQYFEEGSTVFKDDTDRRPKVNYENEVESDALRTLTIQKRLYREDGITEIGYDENQTEFAFRLELGIEYSDLEAANMHTYYVKDPDG